MEAFSSARAPSAALMSVWVPTPPSSATGVVTARGPFRVRSERAEIGDTPNKKKFQPRALCVKTPVPYRSLAECATCKLGPVYSNMRMSLLFVSQSEDARRPSHLTFAPLPWLGLSLQQAASLLSPRSLSLSLSLPTLFVVCAAGYGSDSRCDSNRRCGGDRRGGDGTRRALSTVSHAPLP